MSKRANRQKRKAEAPKAALAEVEAQIKAGLRVFESDEADEVIKSIGPMSLEEHRRYRELIQAVPAQAQILYSLLLAHGLRRDQATLKASAQSQTIVLQLVHNAYALGIEHALLSREKKDD